jgi:triacylglycerol lipase
MRMLTRSRDALSSGGTLFRRFAAAARPSFRTSTPTEWRSRASYTDIVTKYDELVEPYTSGILDAPGVTNITLQEQCPIDFSDHLTAAFDPTAAQDILNALDPAHARAVPCTLVLPGVGAPLPPSTVGLG